MKGQSGEKENGDGWYGKSFFQGNTLRLILMTVILMALFLISIVYFAKDHSKTMAN